MPKCITVHHAKKKTMQTFFLSLLTNSFPRSLVLPYFLSARNHQWTFSNSSSIINQQPLPVSWNNISQPYFLSVKRHQAFIECLFWPRPNQFWQLSHLHCPIQWGLHNRKSGVSERMGATQHRLSSHIFQSIAGKCFGTSWLIWAWLLKHAGENCWNTASTCSLDLNFDKVEIDLSRHLSLNFLFL